MLNVDPAIIIIDHNLILIGDVIYSIVMSCINNLRVIFIVSVPI